MEYFYGYEPIPSEDIMDYFTDAQKYAMLPWEDRIGMRVTSGVVTLDKDPQNMVGISIGGGAPHCPCLYIVQVFDNTPAFRDGTLAAGDELVGINGTTVKGRSKVEAARMIQAAKGKVSINFNKLHADSKQGKSLDLILKKVKHRVVENMASSTADALGLSRAILCNDSLVKKLDELERTAHMYQAMMIAAKRFLNAFFNLSLSHKAFGEVFSSIGVKEPNSQASLVFSKFGETHRELRRNAINMIKVVNPMINDMNTFLFKAVPDTKLTIKKYLDTKFEYLSYCLKVKEMDDEDYTCNVLNEGLYRVETGNYEYRLILRCRQEARVRFAKMRSDVMVKLELLDNKHVQDTVFQLQRLVAALARCHTENHIVMKDNQLFPIEVDLSRGTFDYNTTGQQPADDDYIRGTSTSYSSVTDASVCLEKAETLSSLENDDSGTGSNAVELAYDWLKSGNECKNEEVFNLMYCDGGDFFHVPKLEVGDHKPQGRSNELEKDLQNFFSDTGDDLNSDSTQPPSPQTDAKTPITNETNYIPFSDVLDILRSQKDELTAFSSDETINLSTEIDANQKVGVCQSLSDHGNGKEANELVRPSRSEVLNANVVRQMKEFCESLDGAMGRNNNNVGSDDDNKNNDNHGGGGDDDDYGGDDDGGGYDDDSSRDDDDDDGGRGDDDNEGGGGDSDDKGPFRSCTDIRSHLFATSITRKEANGLENDIVDGKNSNTRETSTNGNGNVLSNSTSNCGGTPNHRIFLNNSETLIEIENKLNEIGNVLDDDDEDDLCIIEVIRRNDDMGDDDVDVDHSEHHQRQKVDSLEEQISKFFNTESETYAAYNENHNIPSAAEDVELINTDATGLQELRLEETDCDLILLDDGNIPEDDILLITDQSDDALISDVKEIDRTDDFLLLDILELNDKGFINSSKTNDDDMIKSIDVDDDDDDDDDTLIHIDSL